jgi:copper oxidase (laccase) domain-containing protein
MIAAFRHMSYSDPADLLVAIGPAIRACCYEVGQEFADRFGRFVHTRKGRLTCDLIGVATEQFRQAGIRAEHLFDSGHCTGCERGEWFSLRREGQAAGRLTSLIMLRP